MGFSSKTIFLSRELIFTLNHPLVSESEFLRVLPKLRTVILIVFDFLPGTWNPKATHSKKQLAINWMTNQIMTNEKWVKLTEHPSI